MDEEQNSSEPLLERSDPSNTTLGDKEYDDARLSAGLGENADLLAVPATVNDDQTWERGEMQPTRFRDWPYAIVFLSQYVLVTSYGSIIVHKLPILEHVNGDRVLEALEILASVGIFFGLYAFFSFWILTKLGAAFIEISLWTSVAISVMCTILSIVHGYAFAAIMFGLNSLFCACYAVAVKPRIPFAAANLNAAITAITKNIGIFLIPFAAMFVHIVYVVMWICSLTLLTGATFDESNNLEVPRPGWVFPFVFVLFWTDQVWSNGVQTIVAGVVATWYFDPAEANGCCSKAVRSSAKRAMTSSFGSICLGSLLVATIQFLDWIVRSARQSRAENRESGVCEALLLCCLDCILRILEDILTYFNKWAFIYVGIYGYTYTAAGSKVMALFQQRGWTVIINDNLVSNALVQLSFIVALLVGITSSFAFSYAGTIWFGLGLGFYLALTFANVLVSAVNTIIVCFAEAPQDLQRNHGALSRQMREAWNKVYPTVHVIY